MRTMTTSPHLLYTSAQAPNGRDSAGTTTNSRRPSSPTARCTSHAGGSSHTAVAGACPVRRVHSPRPRAVQLDATVTSPMPPPAGEFTTPRMPLCRAPPRQVHGTFGERQRDVQAIAVGTAISERGRGAPTHRGRGTTSIIWPDRMTTIDLQQRSAPLNGGSPWRPFLFGELARTSISWNGNVYNFGPRVLRRRRLDHHPASAATTPPWLLVGGECTSEQTSSYYTDGTRRHSRAA